MGSLKKIKIARAPVKLDDGQEFDVRAISTSDLMILVREHGAAMTLIFGRLANGDSAPLDSDTVKNAILAAAREFPDLAAELIALASDSYDEEGIEIARALGFPAQVEAIEKIFGLTFASEGAVKKLVESLTRAILGVSGALATTTSALPTGIGDFADERTFS